VTRVLLVHQPTDGGVGRHVRDLANGFVARGYETFVCGPGLPPAPLDALVGHRHLDSPRAVSPLADLAACLRLARIVRELKPDVVHAHSSKAGAIARVARALHPGIPLVYSPHGYAFNGYFERRAERRAYRAAEQLLARAASRVICVCEAEAGLARAVGPASRVRVVHNGIAPAEPGPPDPRILELGETGPIVGALTLLRPGKGLETLIDAAPELIARHPQLQVVIAGDGPSLEALRARARARGVLEAVRFVGPSDDPLGVLSAIDVFVHPSWAESFPYVVLEAMSLSKPIVASDVGGIREAVDDGVSGLLVAPRDPRELAASVSRVLGDPAAAAQMGQRGLERVERDFPLAGMIDGVAAVYDELVIKPDER
jgi:glycosyltransferase involved in cell wall biosynthesis